MHIHTYIYIYIYKSFTQHSRTNPKNGRAVAKGTEAAARHSDRFKRKASGRCLS